VVIAESERFEDPTRRSQSSHHVGPLNASNLIVPFRQIVVRMVLDHTPALKTD